MKDPPEILEDPCEIYAGLKSLRGSLSIFERPEGSLTILDHTPGSKRDHERSLQDPKVKILKAVQFQTFSEPKILNESLGIHKNPSESSKESFNISKGIKQNPQKLSESSRILKKSFSHQIIKRSLKTSRILTRSFNISNIIKWILQKIQESSRIPEKSFKNYKTPKKYFNHQIKSAKDPSKFQESYKKIPQHSKYNPTNPSKLRKSKGILKKSFNHQIKSSKDPLTFQES